MYMFALYIVHKTSYIVHRTPHRTSYIVHHIVHVCMYAGLYVCMYVCMYIHSYLHAHCWFSLCLSTNLAQMRHFCDFTHTFISHNVSPSWSFSCNIELFSKSKSSLCSQYIFHMRIHAISGIFTKTALEHYYFTILLSLHFQICACDTFKHSCDVTAYAFLYATWMRWYLHRVAVDEIEYQQGWTCAPNMCSWNHCAYHE